jgi:hypothetical protein
MSQDLQLVHTVELKWPDPELLRSVRGATSLHDVADTEDPGRQVAFLLAVIRLAKNAPLRL